MSENTLMTDQANQTTDAANAASSTAATAAKVDGANQQQASEGAATAVTEGAKGEEGEASAKPEGAPEKYDFKAPEGQSFDESVIGVFSEAAKELNLTQDAAQKMLDKVGPVIASRQVERFDQISTEWQTQTRGDKEFGGDKLDENLGVAKKTLDTFGTPELSKLLADSRMGNHPEVVRLFYRVGKAISEDKFVKGGNAVNEQTDLAKKLYPNQL